MKLMSLICCIITISWHQINFISQNSIQTQSPIHQQLLRLLKHQNSSGLTHFLHQHPEYLSTVRHPAPPINDHGNTVAHILIRSANFGSLFHLIRHEHENCATSNNLGSPAFLDLCLHPQHAESKYGSKSDFIQRLAMQNPGLITKPRYDGTNSVHACAQNQNAKHFDLLLFFATLNKFCFQPRHLNGSVLELLLKNRSWQSPINGKQQFYFEKIFQDIAQQEPSLMTPTIWKHLRQYKQSLLIQMTQQRPESPPQATHASPELSQQMTTIPSWSSCTCCEQQCYCCQNIYGQHADYWYAWYLTNPTHPDSLSFITTFEHSHPCKLQQIYDWHLQHGPIHYPELTPVFLHNFQQRHPHHFQLRHPNSP